MEYIVHSSNIWLPQKVMCQMKLISYEIKRLYIYIYILLFRKELTYFTT